MTKENKELKITKDRVLEAARAFPNAKMVLERLFPEAFEKKLYTCGTIFRDKEASRFYPLKSLQAFVELTSETLGCFYILCYTGQSRTYHLVNLGTGFTEKGSQSHRSWEGKMFIQLEQDKGVEISDEYLEKLEVYQTPHWE